MKFMFMLWLSTIVDGELHLVKYVDQFESAEECWQSQELLHKATDNSYTCTLAQAL